MHTIYRCGGQRAVVLCGSHFCWLKNATHEQFITILNYYTSKLYKIYCRLWAIDVCIKIHEVPDLYFTKNVLLFSIVKCQCHIRNFYNGFLGEKKIKLCHSFLRLLTLYAYMYMVMVKTQSIPSKVHVLCSQVSKTFC